MQLLGSFSVLFLVGLPQSGAPGSIICMIYLPEVKIRKEMKSILWYILWGWVFYLVPLLGLASCALGEDMGTLIRQLWTYASENWMNLLAEFTLSDVVLSDMFFLLLAEDMCAN